MADLVCLEKHLVIEVDGSQHAQKEFSDARRTAYFEGMGFSVLRFWDNDVLLRIESVMEQIYKVLEMTPHPNPLPENPGRGDNEA